MNGIFVLVLNVYLCEIIRVEAVRSRILLVEGITHVNAVRTTHKVRRDSPRAPHKQIAIGTRRTNIVAIGMVAEKRVCVIE